MYTVNQITYNAQEEQFPDFRILALKPLRTIIHAVGLRRITGLPANIDTLCRELFYMQKMYHKSYTADF